MRFLLLIVYVLMMFNISVVFSLEGENPYKEGVERVKLTEAEKVGLLKFINSSKYLLEKALSDAKGKTLSEANRSYYKTILMVVMESYKNKRRGELLMRYALNQALELTYGIPTDDGKGIEKEGILKNVSNTDLLTVILEDSIKLAIDYYEKDKLAIEGLDLVNLPYIEFSQKKLLLSWNWLSSIFEYDVLLDFEIAVLEQWLLTVKNEETLETETVSPMIYEVVEALERVNTENHKIERKGEYLKGIIYKLKNQKMILNKNNIKNSNEVKIVSNNEETSFHLVTIKAGEFDMGSPRNEEGRYDDEILHRVKISKDFDIMTTEVTQLQWFTVMGSNPSHFKSKEYCDDHMVKGSDEFCPNNPVERVSWEEVQVFIEKLNKETGEKFRLPTEAEWEYAAKGTTKITLDNMDEFAWFSDNSNDQTQKVAKKRANDHGLYDMNGNVWEWVQDAYKEDLGTKPVTDPINNLGSLRVRRGGSWYSDGLDCRSSDRDFWRPDDRFDFVGFRLVRTR